MHSHYLCRYDSLALSHNPSKFSESAYVQRDINTMSSHWTGGLLAVASIIILFLCAALSIWGYRKYIEQREEWIYTDPRYERRCLPIQSQRIPNENRRKVFLEGPVDNTSTFSYHHHDANLTKFECPCGCDRVQILNCIVCHQPSIGCSECYRRLSPCQCDTRASYSSSHHRTKPGLPSALQQETIIEIPLPPSRSDHVPKDQVEFLEKQLAASMKQGAEMQNALFDIQLREAKHTKLRLKSPGFCLYSDQVSFDEIQAEEHCPHWKRQYRSSPNWRQQYQQFDSRAKERQKHNARLLRQKWIADRKAGAV